MPKRIGKYEITVEIGRGGFSRVYRGFDPNVNRPVAIKVSTRESDPEHLSRFRNEASAAGNLRHENIVTIHDYGDDDGVPYLVMELLEGRDLHHIMRDGPKMSLLEKMQVMSQVGEGLRCAHLNGVVHRDIKPANVMVLADGTVKILDFGIARMTGEVSRLTQSGYLVGTPLYMSPEQLQGGDADALCDVWAYGVLYFELLTGQHPFLSQDNSRLIRNITIVNPPSVHSLTHGVPDGLAQVIRRALTKDRRRRYQSLEDVLVDTNPILALLQREQTTGLVSEAQFYRSSGQLAAARQTSRRALEIDPSHFGAQQLLKSIQHEMQEERLVAPPPAVSQQRAAEPFVAPPPPPAAVRMAPPPAAVVEQEPDLREMIPADKEAAAPAVAIPELTTPVPVVPVVAEPAVAATPMPAAAALAKPSMTPAGADTPAATPQRLRPGLASGAAAAIAAAVAAAKARQAEEEKLQKETKPEEEATPTAPAPIKTTPLVVSSPPISRVTPMPQPAASLKRAENGSGAFLTDDPLVVKRPATAVMAQRMNASDSSAAVATPIPAPPPPPTRLPGTKAIPASVPRAINGTVDAKASASVPAVDDSRRVSENLPMRRPPAEVYAKGKRKYSSAIFADKKAKKPFPWPVIGFVAAVALAAAALIMFALSAPKLVNTPVLAPDKLAFSWKPGTPKPQEQILRLKGGSASSSFSATSSDEEWLTVTPQSDEPTNRSWQVKVDPEKVGPTGPNGTSGWIDVTSTEGFKTQEEVIVKVGGADVTPATPKAKKQGVTEPRDITPVLPVPVEKKPLIAAPSAEKGTAVGNSVVSSEKTAANKSAATAEKPVAVPTPTAKKQQPVNDGTDVN
jgi:hypothetical protein